MNTAPHAFANIPRRVLGVDLGIRKLGWAHLEAVPTLKRPVVLEAGTLMERKAWAGMNPGVRASAVWAELAEIIDRLNPDAIAVEDFTLRGAKSNVIPVHRIAGALDTLRGHRKHPATFYPQEEWQRLILGRARQDKDAVGGIMRVTVLGFERLRTDHEVDAAAVAAAHIFVCRARARDMGRASRPAAAATPAGGMA